MDRGSSSSEQENEAIQTSSFWRMKKPLCTIREAASGEPKGEPKQLSLGTERFHQFDESNTLSTLQPTSRSKRSVSLLPFLLLICILIGIRFLGRARKDQDIECLSGQLSLL